MAKRGKVNSKQKVNFLALSHFRCWKNRYADIINKLKLKINKEKERIDPTIWYPNHVFGDTFFRQISPPYRCKWISGRLPQDKTASWSDDLHYSCTQMDENLKYPKSQSCSSLKRNSQKITWKLWRRKLRSGRRWKSLEWDLILGRGKAFTRASLHRDFRGRDLLGS